MHKVLRKLSLWGSRYTPRFISLIQWRPTLGNQWCLVFVLSSMFALSGCQEARRDDLTGGGSSGAGIQVAGAMGGEREGGELEGGEAIGGELVGGDVAGDVAGDEAGESAPVLQPHEVYDLMIEPLISGIDVRSAWYLNERWLLLTEYGLLMWAPSVDIGQLMAGAPPQLTLSEGTLSGLRFDPSGGGSTPTVAPVSALSMGNHEIILFPDEVWVNEVDERGERWIRSPLSEYIRGARGVAWMEGELWVSDQNGLGRWSASDETWSRDPALALIRQGALRVGAWQSGSALWAQVGLGLIEDEPASRSGEVYAIAEGGRWRDETWWSDQEIAIVDAQSAGEEDIRSTIWGSQEGRLIGGVVGFPWEPVAHPFLSALEVQALWSGLGELWMIADQRIWRASNAVLLDPVQAANSSLGYAQLEGSWWGGDSVDAGSIYLWGPHGFIRAILNRTPMWLSDEPSLGTVETRFALTGVNFEEDINVQAWLSATEPSVDTIEPPEVTWDLKPTQGQISLGRSSIPASLTEVKKLWLVALVEHPDREPQLSTLEVQVIPAVTWGEDILPLFERACSACHDGAEGARDLSGPDLWEIDIDVILFVTEAQSMPIGAPPLTAEEVERIRAWRRDGFLRE